MDSLLGTILDVGKADKRTRPATPDTIGVYGMRIRRIAAVDGDREPAATQKEHPGDEGLVRARAREVRVDERVADGEGEGGSKEAHSDKDSALLESCAGGVARCARYVDSGSLKLSPNLPETRPGTGKSSVEAL